MYDKILEVDYCDAVRDIKTTMKYFNVSKDDIFAYAKTARKRTRRMLVDCPLAKEYIARNNNPHHELKIIPSYYSSFSDYGLMNNTVYHISYENSIQPLGMIIQDNAFFTFQKAMFDAMWENL
jgi:hypothetical protein